MHKGSCHCGAIAFEVEGDLEQAFECNCSHCSRKGYLLWFVPREHLTLDSPDSALATYRFNKHVIDHHFCPTCGCAPFGVGIGPSGDPTAAVNVRCLEDVDLATLKRVPSTAGASRRPAIPQEGPMKRIIPHIVVDDAAAAIDFYIRAFGAVETARMPAEDGKRLLHAEVAIDGAPLMLHDHFPEYASPGADASTQIAPPTVIGGTPVTLHLWVEDCDAAVKRAADAGAAVTMEPWDAFWGDRYAQIRDPFGHSWSLAHPLPGKSSSKG